MQTQTPEQMASRIVLEVLYEAAPENTPKGAAARAELQRRRRERRERTQAAMDAAKAGIRQVRDAVAILGRLLPRDRF
jgi:hypothetical protein